MRPCWAVRYHSTLHIRQYVTTSWGMVEMAVSWQAHPPIVQLAEHKGRGFESHWAVFGMGVVGGEAITSSHNKTCVNK